MKKQYDKKIDVVTSNYINSLFKVLLCSDPKSEILKLSNKLIRGGDSEKYRSKLRLELLVAILMLNRELSNAFTVVTYVLSDQRILGGFKVENLNWLRGKFANEDYVRETLSTFMYQAKDRYILEKKYFIKDLSMEEEKRLRKYILRAGYLLRSENMSTMTESPLSITCVGKYPE